jgi:L-amino acid N-acyltransferase YncA
MEKICYVVIMSSRKLWHIFCNKYSSRRVSKWAMELSEYVVNFEKHNAIKSQVLADFVAEWTEPRSVTEGEVLETLWVVYYDRA